MKIAILLVSASLVLGALTACLKSAAVDATVDPGASPTTSPTDGASPAPSSSPVPTYGMNCTGYNGGDSISSSTPAMSYVTSINGSGVTSIELFFSLGGSVQAVDNYVTQITVTPYTCVNGTLTAVTNGAITHTPALHGQLAATGVTFDFTGVVGSGGFAIPSTFSGCAGPIGFQIATTSGYGLVANSGGTSSSCNLIESSNTYRSYSAVITALP